MKQNTDFSIVEIDTEFGRIMVRVNLAEAPVSAGNFLKYVDHGLFNGTSFYRIVTPENDLEKPVHIAVVQGGLREGEPTPFPPIEHEPTNATGLQHLDGVISMARRKLGTAAGAFFICVGDQPELDSGGGRHDDGLGFAAFGQVTEGMEVVRRIWQCAEATPYPERDIKITRVFRRS